MKPLARFDGAAAWAALNDEQRARIGHLGLELAVASAVACVTENDPEAEISHRAAQAAGNMLVTLFDRVVMEALPPGALENNPVPSLLGPVCRQCGCSELDACGFGCAWADIAKTVCTSCAPGMAMRRAGASVQ